MPRKVYASVATARLNEELPNIPKDVVLSSIFNNTNVSNDFLLQTLTGPVSQLNNMKRYGESSNYHFGRASVDMETNVRNRREIWESNLGNGAIVTDTFTITSGVGDPEAYALQAFIDNPLPGGEDFSRFEYLPTSVNLYKIVSGIHEVLYATVQLPTITTPEHYARYTDIIGFDEEEIYSDPKIAIYNEASNTIPELHLVGGTTLNIGAEMYPLVPLRVNGVSYQDSNTGNPVGVALEGSDSIKKILSKISIDPNVLMDVIRENPNDDLIDDVYLGTGISLINDEEWGIATLAETFAELHKLNTTSFDSFTSSGRRQQIRFRVRESGALNTTIDFNYIRVEKVTGAMGYTKSFIPGEHFEACELQEDPADEEDVSCDTVGSTNQYIFTRPINDYEHEVITVSGLTQVHYVDTWQGFKIVRFTEGSEPGLTIPLLQNVIRKIPYRLRNDAVLGSLILYVYAIETVHLEWYETGLFNGFIQFIGLALALYTGGSSLGLLAGASLTTFSIIFLKLAITFALSNYAIQWAVEQGGLLAFVAVVGLVLYTGKIDLTSLSTTLNTAGYELISASIKYVGEYTTLQFEELRQEIAAFENDYEQRLEEFEAAEELLDYNTNLNFLGVVNHRSQPNTTINEDPQSFYDRTSSIIDLSQVSSSLVDDFYDINLRLPEVDSYQTNHKFS